MVCRQTRVIWLGFSVFGILNLVKRGIECGAKWDQKLNQCWIWMKKPGCVWKMNIYISWRGKNGKNKMKWKHKKMNQSLSSRFFCLGSRRGWWGRVGGWGGAVDVEGCCWEVSGAREDWEELCWVKWWSYVSRGGGREVRVDWRVGCWGVNGLDRFRRLVGFDLGGGGAISSSSLLDACWGCWGRGGVWGWRRAEWSDK